MPLDRLTLKLLFMHLKCIVTTLAAATILTAQPCAAAQSTGADSPPSVAVINQRLLDTTQDSSLDDAAKAGIRGLYQQALSELEAAARWRVAALDFARRTTDAPAVRAQLERR